ncbi:MAG: hypothetical protein IKF96_00620, partial [Eggerthellaceae bacterium]|nr:hypothetical protein [Eggerthellaceae bacterium]
MKRTTGLQWNRHRSPASLIRDRNFDSWRTPSGARFVFSSQKRGAIISHGESAYPERRRVCFGKGNTMIYLLYNPLANNSKGEEDAKAWAADNGV